MHKLLLHQFMACADDLNQYHKMQKVLTDILNYNKPKEIKHQKIKHQTLNPFGMIKSVLAFQLVGMSPEIITLCLY